RPTALILILLVAASSLSEGRQPDLIAIAGLQETYPYGGNAAIPSLWQKFNAHFGHISGQKGKVAYGVCTHIDGEAEKFRYMAAVEIS
ncbi:GyrI-like domain-containing protein, partial [Rhizobium johnstonii]